EARARAGVAVSIIGRLKVKNSVLPEPRGLPIRLHTRSMIRDGSWAFVGSQSLRSLELDARREVGIVFRDPKAVGRLLKTFREDWESKAQPAVRRVTAAEAQAEGLASATKVAKKVAKAIVED